MSEYEDSSLVSLEVPHDIENPRENHPLSRFKRAISSRSMRAKSRRKSRKRRTRHERPCCDCFTVSVTVILLTGVALGIFYYVCLRVDSTASTERVSQIPDGTFTPPPPKVVANVAKDLPNSTPAPSGSANAGRYKSSQATGKHSTPTGKRSIPPAPELKSDSGTLYPLPPLPRIPAGPTASEPCAAVAAKDAKRTEGPEKNNWILKVSGAVHSPEANGSYRMRTPGSASPMGWSYRIPGDRSDAWESVKRSGRYFTKVDNDRYYIYYDDRRIQKLYVPNEGKWRIVDRIDCRCMYWIESPPPDFEILLDDPFRYASSRDLGLWTWVVKDCPQKQETGLRTELILCVADG